MFGCRAARLEPQCARRLDRLLPQTVTPIGQLTTKRCVVSRRLPRFNGNILAPAVSTTSDRLRGSGRLSCFRPAAVRLAGSADLVLYRPSDLLMFNATRRPSPSTYTPGSDIRNEPTCPSADYLRVPQTYCIRSRGTSSLSPSVPPFDVCRFASRCPASGCVALTDSRRAAPSTKLATQSQHETISILPVLATGRRERQTRE